MSFFGGLGIGSIIKGVGDIADDLYTTEEEKLKLALQDKTIDAEIIKGQMAVNQAEASNKSVFVAGWRPFIGWIGGFALGYQFLFYPLLSWLWFFLQAQDIIPAGVKIPPKLNAADLYPIILGMLGIGGMRSFDKYKKVQTDKIK